VRWSDNLPPAAMNRVVNFPGPNKTLDRGFKPSPDNSLESGVRRESKAVFGWSQPSGPGAGSQRSSEKFDHTAN